MPINAVNQNTSSRSLSAPGRIRTCAHGLGNHRSIHTELREHYPSLQSCSNVWNIRHVALNSSILPARSWSVLTAHREVPFLGSITDEPSIQPEVITGKLRHLKPWHRRFKRTIEAPLESKHLDQGLETAVDGVDDLNFAFVVNGPVRSPRAEPRVANADC